MTSGPLEGVRIVELCSLITGPMATVMLADQGAEVIKVEAPRGDIYRLTGTIRGGQAAMFMTVNRNKRSIVLDAKDPDQKEALLTLISEADVFIQNMKPGSAARLGLDPETLRAKFPRLICASVSGYGQTGPKAFEGAVDPMIQAISGIAAIQGGKKGDKPQLVRTLLPDKTTSMIIAQAITSALFQRERTGQGCTVECAMLDAVVWWLWPDAMMNNTFVGKVESISDDVSEADWICKTDDGHLVVAPYQEGAWQTFTELVNRTELLDDPRFGSVSSRTGNLEAFTAVVRESFAGKTTDEWCSFLQENGIPCAPVVKTEDIASNPQVIWNKVVEELEHPSAGTYRSVRSPVLFDGVSSSVRRHSPGLGEHTSEISSEFGFELPSD